MNLEKKNAYGLQPAKKSKARVAMYVGGGAVAVFVGYVALKFVIGLLFSLFWYIAIIAGAAGLGYVGYKALSR